MAYYEKKICLNGHEAELQVNLWDNLPDFQTGKKRPLILVVPGGGYSRTSDREADPIAYSFLAMGYHTAILRYSVRPVSWPQQLEELAWSMQYLRSKAEDWFIDPEKIAVIGFSAGGSLTAELGVHWHEPWLAEAVGAPSPECIRPNLQMLIYAVLCSDNYPQISTVRKELPGECRISPDSDAPVRYISSLTPPTFLVHALGDPTVSPDNALFFAEALRKNKIPLEFHLYQNGSHGFALANYVTNKPTKLIPDPTLKNRPGLQTWVEQAGLWLEGHFHTWDKEVQP